MKAALKLIDHLRGTNVMGAYEAVLRKQTTEEKGLLEEQKTNLHTLLLTIKRHNRFYSELLEEISNQDIHADSVAVLKQLPIVDKTMINEHREQIFCPVPGRRPHRKKTGGSSGTPFHYYVDSEYVTHLWAHIYATWHRHAGYTPGLPFVTVAGNSLRAVSTSIKEKFFLPFRESLYYALQNNLFLRGDVIRADMPLDHARLGKAILIYGYPSTLSALLTVNPNFPSFCRQVRAVFTTSEQLLPQTRRFLENALGVPVFDMYGANDGGLLSCECRFHQGHHFNMHNCFVETWQNEEGHQELLLTNLISYSFPFVRYRVGDIGSISTEPCLCGLGSHRIVELKGRARDLIRLPSGGIVHGSLFNKVMFRFPVIKAYRVMQDADYTVKVYVSVESEDIFIGVTAEIQKLLLGLLPGVKVIVFQAAGLNLTNKKAKLIESHAA
jgi:phenylacetate-CoA ligase